MSTHTPTKPSAKRELEMSPAKKKPKEATSISKDDLDAAILSGVSKALKEQQRNFDASVAHAVKEALDRALIPQLTTLKEEISTANEVIRKVISDVQHQASETQKTYATVQSLHATVRSNKHDLNDVLTQLAKLQDKMIEMEDRSRRNNLRLVNLPESVGGSNLKAFVVANLPKWIPSLAGQRIEIDRCHRIYDGSIQPRGEDKKPRTVIFRLLRFSDRQDILQGARKAKPKHGNSDLFFFPDYSPQTSAKRREFVPVIDKLSDRGIRSFLLYPATLKVEHGGSQLYFNSPAEVERFLTTHEPGERPPRPPTTTAPGGPLWGTATSIIAAPESRQGAASTSAASESQQGAVTFTIPASESRQGAVTEITIAVPKSWQGPATGIPTVTAPEPQRGAAAGIPTITAPEPQRGTAGVYTGIAPESQPKPRAEP